PPRPPAGCALSCGSRAVRAASPRSFCRPRSSPASRERPDGRAAALGRGCGVPCGVRDRPLRGARRVRRRRAGEPVRRARRGRRRAGARGRRQPRATPRAWTGRYGPELARARRRRVCAARREVGRRRLGSGDDWAVSQADIPSVVPVDGEHWVAHWPVTSAAGFLAYDIAVAVSADGGATWSEPRLLNDDGTATEHGFVSWFPLDGAVGVVWLDGRDLAAEPEEGDEAPLLGTSLRFARLDYGGRVLEQGVIDAVACDCCQTDVVLGAAGPLVVYRDRTAEERRDVVARRFDGRRWSEPLELGADGWIIAGCPVNGPAADALGDTVAVA